MRRQWKLRMIVLLVAGAISSVLVLSSCYTILKHSSLTQTELVSEDEIVYHPRRQDCWVCHPSYEEPPPPPVIEPPVEPVEPPVRDELRPGREKKGKPPDPSGQEDKRYKGRSSSGGAKEDRINPKSGQKGK